MAISVIVYNEINAKQKISMHVRVHALYIKILGQRGICNNLMNNGRGNIYLYWII